MMPQPIVPIRPIRILIEVEGGCVLLPIVADNDYVEIYLVDHDNLDLTAPEDLQDAVEDILDPLRPEQTADFQAALDAAVKNVK